MINRCFYIAPCCHNFKLNQIIWKHTSADIIPCMQIFNNQVQVVCCWSRLNVFVFLSSHITPIVLLLTEPNISSNGDNWFRLRVWTKSLLGNRTLFAFIHIPMTLTPIPIPFVKVRTPFPLFPCRTFPFPFPCTPPVWTGFNNLYGFSNDRNVSSEV